MGLKGMKWTVIFDDKNVTCQSVLNDEGFPTPYKVNDDAFWNDPKWNDIHAIQFIDDSNDHNDCVEMVPGTFGRNKTWAEAELGDFRSQFIDPWDAAHLAALQSAWDDDVIKTYDAEGNETSSESEADQIARKGERPTSYTSP